MLRIKRIYETPDPADGARILVDRLWPRGMTAAEARIDEWRKDLAPTGVLRQWFGHDPGKWREFRVRYRNELRAARKMEDLRLLAERAKRGPVTLVYAARDETINHAVVLMEIVESILKNKAA